MPDTAASAAAANGAIHLRREYLIIGDPMWLDAWGEIPYFLRKSRQNAGIELKFECRDALPAPLPARIAELGFAVYGGFFTKDERRGAERHYSRSLQDVMCRLCHLNRNGEDIKFCV